MHILEAHRPTPPSRRSSARFLPLGLALCASLGVDEARAGVGASGTSVASATRAQGEEEEEESPRGLVTSESDAFAGYTLFSPLRSREILLIDMHGKVAHRWETELLPTGAVYLLDDGHLLRCANHEPNPRFRGGGIGGRVQKIDWDGNVVWDYTLANEQQTQHHDIEPLPNGNVLMIAWEYASRAEAVQWGRDPRASSSDGFWTLALLEVRPEGATGGEVVWEWHAWDHLIQDFDRRADGYGDVVASPGKIDINADHRDQPPLTAEEQAEKRALEEQMRALGYLGGDEEDEDDGDRNPGHGADWLHTNGIDYHPAHDLIVVSVPHMGELWVIDHSTDTEEAAADYGGRFDRGGELLYRWGNPRTYGRGDEGDKRLFYQHDPTWLFDAPDGELRLLVFNNGGGRKGGDFSSVEELVLPFDSKRGFLRASETAFGPAEPAWSYESPDDFFSPFISGAQRLPNGHTLICSGVDGRVFEVRPDGTIAWEWWNEFGGEAAPSQQGGAAPPQALFRATRIAPDHPGLRGRFDD